jgi:hypothetical protein
MENVETILAGLLELVRLDMQLRKTGKETAERRQVEDAINSVRAKVPEPILGHTLLNPRTSLTRHPRCSIFGFFFGKDCTDVRQQNAFIAYLDRTAGTPR